MEEDANLAQDNTDANSDAVETEATETTEATEVKTEETKTEVNAETADEVKPETQAEIDIAKLTLPEGMAMDTELLEKFMPIAKARGYGQEQVQELVLLQAEAASKWIQQVQTHRDNSWNELMAEVKADPELGGEQYEQKIGRINGLIAKYGGDGTVFHQAVAQIAAVDKGKAKQLYATLNSIAKAASVDEELIRGIPRPANGGSALYPGLPGKK